MTTENEQPNLPKPPRTWLTLFMGAVLLISGAVMGSGVTTLVIQKNVQQQRSEGPPPHFNERMMRRLTTELSLTDEQQADIQAIFKDNQERFRTIRRGLREEVETELQSVHERVEAVLDPEQAKIWDQRFEEMGNRSFPGFGDRRRDHYHRDRDRRDDVKRGDWRDKQRRRDYGDRQRDEGLVETLPEPGGENVSPGSDN